MEVSNRVMKYLFFGVLGLLLALVIGGAITKYRYDKQMAQLRNDVASRDKTIEVQKGLYTKLDIETESLKSILDSKDVQVQELLGQVKKNKEDLLAANQLVAQWKKAYEGAATAHQTEVPATDGKVARERVDFKKDFGQIGVSGYTITNPPESWVKVEQLKPLKLTLALSQDAAGAWHTYVTSNDENTSVDVVVAGVNPHILEPRWYENLQLNTMLAGGTNDKGFAFLAGVGVSYRIKQFDVGPAVFLGISDRLDKYYGVTFSWRPFQR